MASTLNSDNGAVSGSAGLKSSADATGVLALQTNGTTAVTVDTSQNVGIGTASPSYKLDVNGSVRGDTFVRATSGSVGSYLVANSGGGFGIVGTATNHPLLLDTNDTERMRIDTSGNVGIGTTAPNYRLDVQAPTGTAAITSTTGTNSAYLAISNSAANTYFGRDSSTGGTFGTAYATVIYSQGAYPINFYANSALSASISSTGLFQFNSGYGSAATAYGCRAWVNFGYISSAISIFGSGNVTSVTRTNTGRYTVAFTTTLVDANYGAVCNGTVDTGTSTGGNPFFYGIQASSSVPVIKTTTQVGVMSMNGATGFADAQNFTVAIIR